MATAKRKTVFKLVQYTTYGFRYPRHDVNAAEIGYFSSREKAERKMHDHIQERDERDKADDEPDKRSHYLGFHITEIPIDDNENTYSYNDQIVSVRSYTPDGKLWDECLVSHGYGNGVESKFYGRNPEDIRFHRGDIVEVLQGSGCSELGIVDCEPPSKQRYDYLAEKAPDWFFMDHTDDCYLIYYLGKGDTHNHPDCTDVFPPAKPVSKSIEKRLREKLSEMQKLYETEK